MKFLLTIGTVFWILLPARGGTLAQFRTVFGDIEVELFDQEKPITVENFKRYVEGGLYQNMFFHRWVPGFVVQGGGFSVENRGSANATVDAVPTLGNITNETFFGALESNQYGTIAMARGTNANSANAQFYFNLGDNSSLDNAPGYSVFGKMVYGTNVLNHFVSAGHGVYPNHNQFVSPFEDLPTLSTDGPDFNHYNDLVYVDVSLLKVQVKILRNTRAISWNSATGLVNRVEFTTNMPPQWQTLTATNGTGATIQVVDLTPTNQFRFYRVTVGAQ